MLEVASDLRRALAYMYLENPDLVNSMLGTNPATD